MKKSEFVLYRGTGMAEAALSHVLLLCFTDLNASQTQGPQTSVPHQGSIQPPPVGTLLLNHQPESLQDAESGGRVDEKIVYLWWLVFWSQKHFGNIIVFAFLNVCSCSLYHQMALRVVFNIQCKISPMINITVKLFWSLCFIIFNLWHDFKFAKSSSGRGAVTFWNCKDAIKSCESRGDFILSPVFKRAS